MSLSFNNRINRQAFIDRIAVDAYDDVMAQIEPALDKMKGDIMKVSGKPVKSLPKIDVSAIANAVYSAMIDRIFCEVAQGNQIVLQGFGSFYLNEHKGHPVQFKADDNPVLSDYLVLKFSATKTANRRARLEAEHVRKENASDEQISDD